MTQIRITGGLLEAEIKDNPLDNLQKQILSIADKAKTNEGKLRDYVDSIVNKNNIKTNQLFSELRDKADSLKMNEEELKAFKKYVEDKITERASHVDRLQNELKSKDKIFKSIEGEMSSLRDFIDSISSAKDEKIASLFTEIEESQKLFEMEMDEIRKEHASLQKNMDFADTNDIDSLKKLIKDSNEKTRSLVDSVNARIDKISKGKDEKISRLKTEINRVNEEARFKIVSVKNRIRDIKPKSIEEALPSNRIPEAKDGTKYMGKLNWKPKLPI